MARPIYLGQITETSTARLTTTVEDFDGTAIGSANITTATWSLLLKSDGSTINSRSGVDMSGDISAAGLLTLVLTTVDNALQSTADSMPETRILSLHVVATGADALAVTKNEEFEYDVVQLEAVSSA